MSSSSKNLNMVIFQPSDAVYYADFNKNTNIIDSLSNVVDSGVATSSDGISWLFEKKINVRKDGSTDPFKTLELWANITLSNVGSITQLGSTHLYRTAKQVVKFPTNLGDDTVSFSDLYTVQLSYKTEADSLETAGGFVVDVTTDANKLSRIGYYICTIAKESTYASKVISIYVKGKING